METEAWKVVPGFSKYEASDQGRVRVIKTGKHLSIQNYPKQYQSVSMAGDGGRRLMLLHRVIAMTFHGECPPGMQTRHDDGNTRNNRADNLLWGTAQQNTDDKRRHGTLLAGESHPKAKLTREDAEEIRRLRAAGARNTALGRRFNIAPKHVRDICAGKYWKAA